jgi:Xaa-Pro aminopeptidase
MPDFTIPREEFLERQRRATEEARRRGLKGLLVWLRGGSMQDRYADVFYLANHYSSFPHIQDQPPFWSGRAHAGLVLPVDDAPALVVEVPDWRRDEVAVDDVRYSGNVPGKVVEVLQEKGLAEGKVGLVALDTMLLGAWRVLHQHLPQVEWVEADDLVESMRAVKSPAELGIIRRACEIGDEIISATMEAVAPGKTEAECIALGYKVGIELGGIPFDMPTASGGPTESQYYSHNYLPTWNTTRKMARGDLFHADCFGSFRGYFWDLSRSTVVGGDATPEQRRILEDAVGVCEAVIAAAKPSASAADLAGAGLGFLESHGYPTGRYAGGAVVAALAESFPAFGHGLGMCWEAPWLHEGDNRPIRENMVLAVERAVGQPEIGGAAYEDDVLVTPSGPEVLTKAPKRWWS